MSVFEHLESEIKEINRVVSGLPDSELKSSLKKKSKRLKHKLNGLRKEQGRSDFETFRSIIGKYLKRLELFYSENISTDGSMEGFEDWFKTLNQHTLEKIVSSIKK